MKREEGCARQHRGVREWYTYICAQPVTTPPEQDLLLSPIPDGCRAPFAAVMVPTHPDPAQMLGYLPDTHGDGGLTLGKLHPIACVLGAGAAKSIPAAMVGDDGRERPRSWQRQGGPIPVTDDSSGLHGHMGTAAAGGGCPVLPPPKGQRVGTRLL